MTLEKGSNKLLIGVSGGLLCALSYAFHMVVTRWAMIGALGAGDIAAIRIGVSLVILIPVFLRTGLARMAGIGLRRGLALSLCAGAPYSWLVAEGLVYAPAGHASVLTPGLIPVFTAMMAWITAGERPSPRGLVGLAIVVAGVWLIGADAFTWHGGQTWIGDLLFVMAAALWAAYTVMLRRWRVDPLRGAAAVALGSAAYLPIYPLLFEVRLGEASVVQLALQAFNHGFLMAVFALIIYARTVAILGPGRAALFVALVPVLGTIGAIPVLGEWPSALGVAGMLVASVGMTVALDLRRSSRREPMPRAS